MSKRTSYIVAVLACAVYWILFIVIIENYGGFDNLGFLWKILFFALPIVGIWKGITSLGKKGKDNGKDGTENTPEQES